MISVGWSPMQVAVDEFLFNTCFSTQQTAGHAHMHHYRRSRSPMLSQMSADIEARRAPLNELRLVLGREPLASAGTAASVGGSPSGSAALAPGRIRNAGSLLGAAAPSFPRNTELLRSLLREPQHVRLWNIVCSRYPAQPSSACNACFAQVSLRRSSTETRLSSYASR